MMLSILATAILAALAMAPGWVLMRGRANHPGQISAAMVVSLTLTMLGTALIGVALEVLMGWQIPAWSLGAVALIAIVFAARVSKESAGPSEAEEAPGFLIGLVFAAFGLFSLRTPASQSCSPPHCTASSGVWPRCASPASSPSWRSSSPLLSTTSC